MRSRQRGATFLGKVVIVANHGFVLKPGHRLIPI
jgi:hypothetical protein